MKPARSTGSGAPGRERRNLPMLDPKGGLHACPCFYPRHHRRPVDLSLSHVLTWRFLAEEPPDIVRVWRAVDALPAARESP